MNQKELELNILFGFTDTWNRFQYLYSKWKKFSIKMLWNEHTKKVAVVLLGALITAISISLFDFAIGNTSKFSFFESVINRFKSEIGVEDGE